MKAFKNILLATHLFLAAAGSVFFWTQLPEGGIRFSAFALLFFFCALDIGYYLYFRKRFVDFSEEMCRRTQQIMGHERGKDGDDHKSDPGRNQETLTAKLAAELEKLEDITRNRLSESEQEKEKLQKTVSEIAHQIKTPLSNIRMYQDMLGETDLSEAERKNFMEITGQQLEKLELLIDSLIKASRLESGMIRLKPEDNSLFYTLEIAVNSIAKQADRKKISLSVRCNPAIKAFHDVKWTAEAIGNILDNAVKYTPEGGEVRIDVSLGEMYAEIKIQDTGKGIEPAHYNDIFKRFYREEAVKNGEGLGLGLYIARKIIMRGGGYILVRSVPGKGSAFSVFLPNNQFL